MANDDEVSHLGNRVDGIQHQIAKRLATIKTILLMGRQHDRFARSKIKLAMAASRDKMRQDLVAHEIGCV